MAILRKATNSEGPAILELVGKVLSAYGLVINPLETDRDLSDLDNYYFNNKGWFSVLESDNHIIGSYGLAFINDQTCELRKMYLLPSFQGKGYGRLMMDEALSKAQALGFAEMTLETNMKLTNAIALYTKYGFQKFIPVHLSDRCDFAMKLELK